MKTEDVTSDWDTNVHSEVAFQWDIPEITLQWISVGNLISLFFFYYHLHYIRYLMLTKTAFIRSKIQ